MHSLTIKNFWCERLPSSDERGDLPVPGWSRPEQGLGAFTEAPVGLSELSTDAELRTAVVILVSAPGAVGKSTLARQIAVTTGAAYVDLAEAAPVGANTLTGGLVKAGLYDAWTSKTVAILLDGLDEARLKVTQGAFDAFIEDVATSSRQRSIPTIMFGRTGAVEEVWLRLQDLQCPSVVVEIGYYDEDSALQFAEAWLHLLAKNNRDYMNTHRNYMLVQHKALSAILRRLREQTELDGRRFAGYAPVIQAVAMQVAKERNPAALLATLEKGEQPVTLRSVADEIMDRERSKLDRLPLQNLFLKDKLYNSSERLARLVAKVLGTPPRGIVLPFMNPHDTAIYDEAITLWANDHPFLVPGRNAPSTAVFDAVIMVAALSNSLTRDQAVARELARGGAANPFLAALHPAIGIARQGELHPEQVGLLYASLRAGLSLGDVATLEVEDLDDADDDSLEASVIISVRRREDEQPTVARFTTTQVGSLKLGAQVEDVEIDVSHATVEIGTRQEATLVSPVVVKCAKLVLAANTLVIEPATSDRLNAAALEADECVSSVATVPIVRKDVRLSVAWPDSEAYPWTSFAASRSPVEDSGLAEGLRRLRKFVISFRSHNKKQLARYHEKIEGRRMIKGSGKKILEALIEDGVLNRNGPMYFLDTDQLSRTLDLSYVKAAASEFSEKAVDFVSRALE